MKKQTIACLFLGCLVSGPAFALSPEDKAESDRRFKLSMDATWSIVDMQARTMTDCGNTVGKMPFKHVEPNITKPATEETWEAIVTVTDWTGGCVDGKRDGAGVIGWTTERRSPRGTDSVARFKAEGRFVRGMRRGLWCNLEFEYTSAGTTSKSDVRGCSLITGEAIRSPQPSYRKQADGRWQLWGGSGPAVPAAYLPAGSLEAESEKLIAAAAAGKVAAPPTLAMQTRALDDLVRGSRIQMALSAAPVPVAGKRVAVVLSSRTLDEIERFKKERNALIAATSGMTGDAARHRASFIEASDPARLTTNIPAEVGTKAGKVLAADDFTCLENGACDYVLVVEWQHLSRFDLLGKFESIPTSTLQDEFSGKATVLAGQSIGAFLVAPGLKAVRQFPGTASISGRKPDAYGMKGDVSYLWQLGNFYAGRWGKGPDNRGTGLVSLTYWLGQ